MSYDPGASVSPVDIYDNSMQYGPASGSSPNVPGLSNLGGGTGGMMGYDQSSNMMDTGSYGYGGYYGSMGMAGMNGAGTGMNQHQQQQMHQQNQTYGQVQHDPYGSMNQQMVSPQDLQVDVNGAWSSLLAQYGSMS